MTGMRVYSSHMETWTCHTDGGARGNPGPSGIGVVIESPKGERTELAQFLGNSTNNYAEYAAVVLALSELKKKLGARSKQVNVEIKLDSELVKKQLSHEYQIKEPSLVPQFIEIHNLRVSTFPHLSFTHIPREKNKDADRLANQAMDRGR
jgi:ribonuclease HI